ncbi:lectin [Alsobacter sp. SYSU M60028]|uniref:Lectin n=2 Tax=Alsobacter ponti TaxID=2962936 RepID=A0ABT1LA07_9HYPH|nr:lectin [Alsobacter ponti]MCP8938311.1 lectin [Alsobacter ponti]
MGRHRMKAASIARLLGPAVLIAAGLGGAQAQQADMSFFVTSVNPGKAGDLGGLAGADAYCQSLAQAAGAGAKTWRAYLSTQAANGQAAVNARDRIGAGPWRNAKGEVIAKSVADLHGDSNNLNKQTALTEKGEIVKGRGDKPNEHDILTGSQTDGTAFPAGDDRTCRNWTSSTDGSAMLGHVDRVGIDESAPMKSWNTSHPSAGCNMDALRKTGGAGLFYCFAAN